MNKQSEKWIDEETGMLAEIFMDGTVNIHNSRKRQDFVFLGSRKETVMGVANAFLRIADKMPDNETETLKTVHIPVRHI